MTNENENVYAARDRFQRALAEADTIEKLDTMRVACVTEMRAIDAQLSDRNRQDSSGNRASGHSYHGWRARAIQTKAELERQISQVKLKLKSANRNFNYDAPVKYETADDLLHASSALIKYFVTELEMTTEELTKVSTLQRALDMYLRSHAKVRVTDGSGAQHG